MIIELTEEFYSDIENERNEQALTKIVDVLNTVFYLMYHHHHIVFSNNVVIRKFLAWGSNRLDTTSLRTLSWMRNNSQNLKAIRDKSKIITQLTLYDNEIKELDEQTIYKIRINDIGELKESVLMTENHDDADFFIQIYHWFNASSFYDVSFSKQAYYGGNVEDAVITTYNENKTILCIVDSDQDYNEGARGATCRSALNAKKVIERKKIKKPFGLYILGVREKENLFPYGQYIDCGSFGNDIIRLMELLKDEDNIELLKYYDIKDGIKRKRLKSKDARYITSHFSFFKKCEEEALVKVGVQCQSCSEDSCESCSEKDEKSIYGIGDKALKTVASVFFKKYAKRLIDDEEISEVFQNQRYLLKEWESISQELFAFGCCISERTMFIS